MENNQEYIDELIARYLSGQATEADKAELSAWKSASAENAEYFEDVSFIYDAASKVTSKHEVDTDKAWNKLSLQIEKEPAIIKLGSNRKPFNVFLRMTAVIVFLVGISSILYVQLRKGAESGKMLSINAGQKDIAQTLPDGSNVIVNQNSSLVALQNNQSKDRQYKLTGKAKFNVVHNDAEPFIIHADNTLIKDIGTSFSVSAVPGQDTISVMVETGSVNFFTDKKEGLILKAHEKGIYLKSTGLFSRSALENQVFPDLQFENATMQEVADKLGIVYGVQIRFGNEHIKSCRITVKFNHSDIRDIIDVISQTFSLQSKTENNIITLYGKGCE